MWSRPPRHAGCTRKRPFRRPSCQVSCAGFKAPGYSHGLEREYVYIHAFAVVHEGWPGWRAEAGGTDHRLLDLVERHLSERIGLVMHAAHAHLLSLPGEQHVALDQEVIERARLGPAWVRGEDAVAGREGSWHRT